jgi:hypothetical protein
MLTIIIASWFRRKNISSLISLYYDPFFQNPFAGESSLSQRYRLCAADLGLEKSNIRFSKCLRATHQTSLVMAYAGCQIYQ